MARRKLSRVTLAPFLLALAALAAPAAAQPPNDDCHDAMPIGQGITRGNGAGATVDGASFCGDPYEEHSPATADVWFRYTATADEALTILGTGARSISVHAACPGTLINQVGCGRFFRTAAGVEYFIRVGAFAGGSIGDFTLDLGPAASISGRVTDEFTGAPIEGATVEIEGDVSSGRVTGRFFTDADGRYSLATVPGSFAAKAGGPDHREELYDDVACEEGYPCFFDEGTRFEVGEREQVTGIDFALTPLGAIAGRVVDASSGEGVARARVSVHNAAGFVESSSADDAGRYRVGGLLPGEYFALASSSDHQSVLYDAIPCPFTGGVNCDLTSGRPITVDSGVTVGDIDFALEPFGGIRGRVTDAVSGQPIEGVYVDTRSLTFTFLDTKGIGTATTDASGRYRIGGLPPGPYAVTTSNDHGYFDELYDDLPCFRNRCDATLGTVIEVGLDRTTAGVDFALDRAGAIAGQVRSRHTGSPLAGVRVSLRYPDGFPAGADVTGVDGRFRLDGLEPGTYFAVAGKEGFALGLYDDLPCDGSVDRCFDSGTPIEVGLNSTTDGVDFELDRFATISGTVTDQATGVPLRSASVRIWKADGEPASSGFAEEGRFRISVPPNTYFVTANSSGGFHAELYDDLPCPTTGCDPTRGTPIEAELYAEVEGVDFTLVRKASIEGTTRDAVSGEPIEAGVVLYDADGKEVGASFIGDGGDYAVVGLEPGIYFAAAQTRDFVGEVYSGIPCEETCDVTRGTPIVVIANTVTHGIDFGLLSLPAIEGTVRSSLTGSPMSNVIVDLWDSQGVRREVDSTGFDGRYRFGELPEGTYFLTTRNFEGILDELYDDRPCLLSSCDPLTGTAVTAQLGTVTRGVDFALDLQQGIAGRVVHEETGLPIPGVEVYFSHPFFFRHRVFSDSAGRYVASLPLGEYVVYTVSSVGGFRVQDEIYDDVSCGRRLCDSMPDLFEEATRVAVTGAVVEGIDFSLSGRLESCVPLPDRLCLNGGRFSVFISWEDFDGRTGEGQAVPLTDDSGYFWFFGPDNVEVVVKVLDACGEPFHSFWVFAAGLTNLATEIRVFDHATEEIRRYRSDLGSAFELVRDTSAFATCPVVPGMAPSPPGEDLVRRTERQLDHALAGLRAGGARRRAAEPALATAAGACAPSPTGLCLAGGRFQVEASWRSPEGESGAARAEPLSADTGYFWFFEPDNVEAIVKVLDACDVPSFESFWVFAAGLTDVEVVLTVTDTVTGEQKTYTNPLGTPYVPVQDTAAFSGCP